MSFSAIKLKTVVNRHAEEKVANDHFFTDLNATATCLICRTKVLFKEFNMKRHYNAKHAAEFDKQKGEERKIMAARLLSHFHGFKDTSADSRVKTEPVRSVAGIKLIYF